MLAYKHTLASKKMFNLANTTCGAIMWYAQFSNFLRGVSSNAVTQLFEFLMPKLGYGY